MARNNKSQVTKQTIKRERQPGGDIPETVMTFIAMHPELFEQYQTHDRDTARIVKMSRVGISREDAEAIAWLLWRARLVRSWTADATTREPTRTWEQAVESGWLKDEMFQMCKDRRAAFYAEREARRERLAGLVKTGAFAEDIEHATPGEKAEEARRQQATA